MRFTSLPEHCYLLRRSYIRSKTRLEHCYLLQRSYFVFESLAVHRTGRLENIGIYCIGPAFRSKAMPCTAQKLLGPQHMLLTAPKLLFVVKPACLFKGVRTHMLLTALSRTRYSNCLLKSPFAITLRWPFTSMPATLLYLALCMNTIEYAWIHTSISATVPQGTDEFVEVMVATGVLILSKAHPPPSNPV